MRIDDETIHTQFQNVIHGVSDDGTASNFKEGLWTSLC
jgi:hypothetical protein